MAPEAVSTTLSPEHIVGLGGITVITGVGLTVTVTVSVCIQPPVVPVTV